MTRTFYFAFALLIAGSCLVGCGNAGDENPISPEQMDANRKADANNRENFKPPDMTKPGG